MIWGGIMSPKKSLDMKYVYFCTVLISACGAPSKSPSDVAGIFSQTDSLEVRGASLCQELKSRTASPSVKDLSFSPTCNALGRDAVEILKRSELYVVGSKDVDPNADNGATYVSSKLRTQIWMNRSLVGLAGAIGNLLKSNQDFKGGEIKAAAPKNGPDLSNLLPTRIDVSQPPQMDINTLSFGLKAGLKIGEPDDLLINNDIEVSGQMINDAIASTIKTVGEKKYEESLIHHFAAVVLVIPYAGDVYVDVELDIAFNKGSGLENILNTMLPQILGSAMKPALDSLLNL